MPSKREPTIRDVAKIAGVSRSTVSRILNNKPDVAEHTRQHVLGVIDELGFRPHAQARSLALGHSRTIALLHPLTISGQQTRFPLVDFILMGFMSGVAKIAEERSYFFNLLTSSFGRQEILDLYRTVQVDGVIVMQVGMQDWRVQLLLEHELPFVMIGRETAHTTLDFVDLDFEDAVITAFAHLAAQGHRHIGFITYPHRMRETHYGPAIHSWAGYQHALRLNNLQANYREVDFSAEAICKNIEALLQENSQITALVNMNTSSLDRSIDALHDLGYRVPDDISVIGFMMDQLAVLMRPRLTNLNFPVHQMGYEAANLLIKRLNNEPVDTAQILLKSALMLRETTGPAPEKD